MQESIAFIGLLVLITGGISFFVKLFDQPIILGYALSGLVASLLFSGMNYEMGLVSAFAVSVMLFIVGLEFDLRKLNSIDRKFVMTTIAQSAIYFSAAFALGLIAGLSVVNASYIGIFFMFSSTFMVAKWVYDRKAGSTLVGRIVLGSLLIQGVLVILARVVIHIISEGSWDALFLTPLYALVMLALAFLSSIVLRRLLKWSEKFPELFFLICLSTCLFFVVAAMQLQFAMEIGAFIGGLVIASSASRSDVLVRFRPHLVFLGIVYFFSKGYQVDLGAGLNSFMLVLFILLLCFSLKPAVAYYGFRNNGYDSRAAFISALYICQIGEVGLTIMITYATDQLKSVALLAVVSSMVLSSYLIKYDRQIYRIAKAYLGTRQKGDMHRVNVDHGIVFFGYQDVGKSIVESYQSQGKEILVIENDPRSIANLKKEKIPHLFDSVNDSRFFARHGFEGVDLVVSSLVDLDESAAVIKGIKSQNPRCIVVVTAKHLKDSLELYSLGADYVIYTRHLREQQVSLLLEEFSTDASRIIEKKVIDLAMLKERHVRLGH